MTENQTHLKEADASLLSVAAKPKKVEGASEDSRVDLASNVRGFVAKKNRQCTRSRKAVLQ